MLETIHVDEGNGQPTIATPGAGDLPFEGLLTGASPERTRELILAGRL